MPSLPDYLSDWPEVQRTCEELGCPFEDVKGLLKNQGLYLGPHDRVPPMLVFDALQRELDAGRPFRPQVLTRVGR